MLGRLFRSLFRILAGATLVTVLLLVTFGLLVRQPVFSALAPAAASRADPERLRRDVRFLAETAAPRDSRHPQNLARAADYLAAGFAAAAGQVSRQTFVSRGASHVNVIAHLGPAGGQPLVVGAHYDAFGDFGANPGADDNASGTAGLLELARLLRGEPLARPVELVAFCCEEPPFFASPAMGSAVYAADLHRRGVRPWGMICLEMIGYYTPTQPWPGTLFRLLFPNRGDFVAVVGRWSDRRLARQVKRSFLGAARVPVASYSGPEIPGMDASDHRSFWAWGIPAVMLTDTAFVRNPNYHSPSDRIATLDFTTMAAVIDGLTNAVLHVAR